MRITPALLLKVAQDTVSQRSQPNHDILTAYLDGSLLAAEPLIGGATDIDLFFVFNSEAVERREIVRVADNVHLDITHHSPDREHVTARIESTIKIAGLPALSYVDYAYAPDGAGSIAGAIRALRFVPLLLLNPWRTLPIERLELRIDLRSPLPEGEWKWR